jgi:hypothetical protein
MPHSHAAESVTPQLDFPSRDGFCRQYERTRPATALNSADAFVTGMRDQPRVIARADSAITARC